MYMLRIFQTSPWVNISCLALVHNYNDSLVIYQQSFSTSLIFQFVSPHDISRVIVAEERNGSLAHHQIAICQSLMFHANKSNKQGVLSCPDLLMACTMKR